MQPPTEPPGPRLDALIGTWLAHKPVLIGICLRWTKGHAADAEDLLSDACVKALEATNVGSLSVVNPVGLWATIISNLGRDRRRRSSRRQGASGPARVALSIAPAAMSRPDDAASAKQQLDVALEALTSLPDGHRIALALRSVGGEYGEIAGQLDTSSGNARKLVQLARGRLKLAIGGEGCAHDTNYPRASGQAERGTALPLARACLFS